MPRHSPVLRFGCVAQAELAVSDQTLIGIKDRR